jgi:hypothetical protein
MHRMVVLAAGAAAALILGIGVGWVLIPKSAPAPEARIAQPELTTGSIAARPAMAAAPQAQAVQPPAFPPPPAFPASMPAPQARPAAAMAPAAQPGRAAVANSRCDNPNALGIARTVEIDTGLRRRAVQGLRFSRTG